MNFPPSGGKACRYCLHHGAAASTRIDAQTMRLALFDLDHTLLSGDSDVLWCEFLINRGLLDPAFRSIGDQIAGRFCAGTVIPNEYYDFYAGTLAGYDADTLLPLRVRFLEQWIRPRIPADARALLQRHRDAGDTLVLTTATNRVISELTAVDLGVDHYICTELEQVNGRFTGRVAGVVNMRTGKVERIRQWLADIGQPAGLLAEATFYSDSINDLALLSAVRQPIVVDPDPRLESTAHLKRWTILRLDRDASRARVGRERECEAP
jgi:HAD superfamily hydrolase (TIGR01490 family)